MSRRIILAVAVLAFLLLGVYAAVTFRTVPAEPGPPNTQAMAVGMLPAPCFIIFCWDEPTEPGLSDQQSKRQPSGPEPLPTCWFFCSFEAQEPEPAHNEYPPIFKDPPARGPNLGGQNPNERAFDRAKANYCRAMPNSPDCR